MPKADPATEGEAGHRHFQILAKQPELQSVAAAVEAFCAANRIPATTSNVMNLALDEVLSNIVKFAYDASAHELIDIELEYAGSRLTATVEDSGRPFNPLQIPRHVSDVPLKDRSQGGLGIIFVTSLLDNVTYDRSGGRNRLTLTVKVPLA
jgi:serine/threonine-protein kinase RsbW